MADDAASQLNWKPGIGDVVIRAASFDHVDAIIWLRGIGMRDSRTRLAATSASKT
ncbi:MAG: hypothetical protein J0H65_06295 [Rhizobiales bacterium]|nr:hypothetical protein [Hyphomicrobiales bacterium]